MRDVHGLPIGDEAGRTGVDCPGCRRPRIQIHGGQRPAAEEAEVRHRRGGHEHLSARRIESERIVEGEVVWAERRRHGRPERTGRQIERQQREREIGIVSEEHGPMPEWIHAGADEPVLRPGVHVDAAQPAAGARIPGLDRLHAAVPGPAHDQRRVPRAVDPDHLVHRLPFRVGGQGRAQLALEARFPNMSAVAVEAREASAASSNEVTTPARMRTSSTCSAELGEASEAIAPWRNAKTRRL